MRAWSKPGAGRHSLQVEINRRLYMDEQTIEKSDGFVRLQADLTALTAEIAAFVRRRLG